jgi:hypothetical protein
VVVAGRPVMEMLGARPSPRSNRTRPRAQASRFPDGTTLDVTLVFENTQAAQVSGYVEAGVDIAIAGGATAMKGSRWPTVRQ